MIFCSNPRAQFLSYESEIKEAINKVLHSSRYILGDEVEGFEREFSSYIGVKHGVGVASGTDAILIALKSCGIGPGDEVITVSNTAVATVSAIELSGATPVLIDIDPLHYGMNHELLDCAITNKTRAIVVVHLYGQPANLNNILPWAKKNNVLVIEDCCQAHGAMYNGKKVGCFGDVGCFSFYPTKNLGAIGDGGMLVTNNTKYYEKARLLREYGWKERYISSIQGDNSRLDELQAAILRVKLKYLDKDNEKRNFIAKIYDSFLPQYITKPSRNDSYHVFHLYVVRSNMRDEIINKLKGKGIIAMIHYPVPIHKQDAYCNRILTPGGMIETEKASKEILSLPIYPELTEIEVMQVIEAFND